MLRERLRALTPLAALALGGWLVLNGLGHTAGVLRVGIGEGKPYDLRFASLLGLGLTMAFAGLLQMGLWRPLKRGERWARRLSAGTALFMVGHVVLLVPVFAAWGMLALHVAYLALLALGLRGTRSPASPSRA